MAPRHPDLSQAIWRKSSYSSSTGQNCVEVAINLPDIIAVRDSKDPGGPTLLMSATAWRRFIVHTTRRRDTSYPNHERLAKRPRPYK
jgi:hypothetical protein